LKPTTKKDESPEEYYDPDHYEAHCTTAITKMNPYNMLNWCKFIFMSVFIVKNKKEIQRKNKVEENSKTAIFKLGKTNS
jgi:hypothetical protein